MRKMLGTCATLALLVLAFASPACAQGYGTTQSGTYNWSGWHLGGNVGWGWRSENPYPAASYYQGLGIIFYDASGGYSTGSSSGFSRHDGFSAGATLGYQYQFGAFVLGVDYDFQYARIADDPRYVTTPFARQTGSATTTTTIYDPYGQTVSTGTGSTSGYSFYTAGNYDPTDGDINRWIGIARLRTGIAIDRLLLFATGGAAYRFSYATADPYVVQPNGSVITYAGYNKADPWGWVLGGGVEYGFSNLMTAKIEYLHMDFGAATYIDALATTAIGRPVLYKYDREVDIVRAGVSFRFNFGGGGATY